MFSTKSIIYYVMIVGMICAWYGCGGRKNSITMAGSTAFQPFAEKLAITYSKRCPGINISVQGGGSAVGIQSAISGAADIGMADLYKLPPEAENLWRTVVAHDGIVIIVHPSNPVTNLTITQIRDIYNGKIRNWKEVGGPERSITVISRESGSGTRTSFEQIVGGITLRNDAIVQDSNGSIRTTVASSPDSIGYISHGLVNEQVKAIMVDGVECSIEAVKSGKYKLVRPVYLLSKKEPQGEVKKFIDWMSSDEGQRIIEESGLLRAK